MKKHRLFIFKRFFEQQVSGQKNYELRKLDRDYQVGDEIELSEIDPEDLLGGAMSTGNGCYVKITSILSNFKGLEPGYGILGTELIRSWGSHKNG